MDGGWDFGQPEQLPGEAAPDAFGVRTGDGRPTDASYAVFPIVRYDDRGYVRLLGTGFFIATTGLFVTARHVLMDTFDELGQERYAIGLIQFMCEGQYLQRRILRCAPHPVADVAVGVAAPMKRTRDGAPLTNPILTLTPVPPELGTCVVTFAYPKHASVLSDDCQHFNFAPTYYDGDLVESLPTGRDRVMMPGACYRTTIVMHGGASGGPVFSRSGFVFGINSTGFDGTDVSYVSRINETFDLTIDDVVLGAAPSRSVPLIEMARAGHILVKPAL